MWTDLFDILADASCEWAFKTGSLNLRQYQKRITAEKLEFVNHVKLRRLETVFWTKPKAAANIFDSFISSAFCSTANLTGYSPNRKTKEKKQAEHENS